MKRLLCYLLLFCMMTSPHIYAKSMVKAHDLAIVPPPPPYDNGEHYEINGEVEIPPPSPHSHYMNCCRKKNKKNNEENQQAKIAISTAALLGIAILGMIFVAHDSH